MFVSSPTEYVIVAIHCDHHMELMEIPLINMGRSLERCKGICSVLAKGCCRNQDHFPPIVFKCESSCILIAPLHHGQI